jgi:signal transduction histidine kinase
MSFLRPYRHPLLFALFAAAVLMMSAWLRPDLHRDTTTSARLIVSGDDPIVSARDVLLRSLDALANGNASEQALYSDDGVLLEWTDAFRPKFPGDDFRPLGEGLHLLKTGQSTTFTYVDSTADGNRWFQGESYPLMDGPNRLHRSPVDGVALHFGTDAPQGLSVRIDSLEWRGVRIAYLLTDSVNSSITRVSTGDGFRWMWSAFATMTLLVVFLWMRRLTTARYAALPTILLLAILPEWTIRFGFLHRSMGLLGIHGNASDLMVLWVSALSYAAAALLLSQVLLQVKRLYGFRWYPRTIGFSIAYGALGGFSLIGLARQIHRISINGSFQVLGIDILPDTSTLSLYFGAALLTAALFLVLALVGWFLMNTETDQIRWMHGFSLVGFMYSLAVGYSVTASADIRLFMVSTAAGLVLYALAFWMHRSPQLFRPLSPFRQLFLVTIMVSTFLYPIFQMATQRQYDQGLTELAVQTARDGIATNHGFGLQSPYRISLYEDGERIEKTGDYVSGQFNDRTRLFPGYRTLEDGERMHREVDGPFFLYQEIAVRNGPLVAVVSARMQNGYNHMFSFVRLIFLLLGLSLVLYPALRLVTGNQIALFRGRERFEYRILDTYIITSFLFLLVLVVLSRQIIVNQSSARVELDLINTLEILADRIDTLQDADLDYFLYEEGRLTDFSEVYQFEGHLPTPLIPQSVYQTLYQNGQDRGVYRSESPIGTLTVVFKKIDDRTVLAIPANLNANKYMDEILQSTNFTIIVYLVIFGLFIGGTVLISREMMHPIHEFRSGLQRIAAGQLDTLIPVTSKDEIGELANAYNLMVFKLKDLQDELADKERQTAWAEMARQVAHEIKNPLTPMKLSIQHLYQQIQYGDKTMDEVKPMITKISETLIREIDSLNNIANDFSKFARPITEEFTMVDVNTSVGSILNLYQHDQRLYLWTDLSEQPLPVFAAPDELKRVLLNLVKNAMEALPQGGIVVIRTYRFGTDAYVEVIDNGSGIAEDLKSRIFVPNFSTKNTGTGLGLAICKKVIEAHKGRIEFASAAGLGTTFTLRIPLSTE